MALEFVRIFPNSGSKGGFVLPRDKILGTPQITGKTEKHVLDSLTLVMAAAAAEGRIPTDTIVRVFTSGAGEIDLRFSEQKAPLMLAAQ